VSRLFRSGLDDLAFDVLGELCVVRNFTLWPSRGMRLTAEALRIAPDHTTAPVTALALYDRDLLYAQNFDGDVLHVISCHQRGAVAWLDASPYAAVHFGCAFPTTARWGVVAAAQDARTWNLAAPALPPTTLTTDEPVIGVAMRDGRPALVVQPHAKRLAWSFAGTRETVTASAPIRQAIVCATEPNLAWLTTTGEIVVYSLQHNAFLLRRTPEAAR
jgi:hypothetical protein